MTHVSNAPATRPQPDVPSKDDPTLGKLVADASRDISALVRGEIALAKSELKVQRQGRRPGLGLFAGAAFLVLLAVIMLSVAFAYFLHMTGSRPGLVLPHRLRGLRPDRRPPRLRRHQEGQAGQGARAGHPPGAGDQEHPQAWLSRRSPPQPRRRRDPGPLAAPSRRCQRGPVPCRGGGTAGRPAGAAAARLPRVLVDLARRQLPVLADAGYRAVAMDLRGYGGSDKTPDGYDPLTLAQDVVRRGQGDRRSQRGPGRARLGRVRRLGDRRAARAGGLGRSARCPHRTRRRCCARLRPGGRRRCGTCSRCRCRGCPSAGWPTRRAATSRDHLRTWSASRLGVPGRARRRDVPAGDRRSGRPRTARWSTTAGCSAPGCAPTAAASAG